LRDFGELGSVVDEVDRFLLREGGAAGGVAGVGELQDRINPVDSL
jgi:hypothetical protein